MFVVWFLLGGLVILIGLVVEVWFGLVMVVGVAAWFISDLKVSLFLLE